MKSLFIIIGFSLFSSTWSDDQEKTNSPEKVKDSPSLKAEQELDAFYNELCKSLFDDAKFKELLGTQAKKQIDVWKKAAQAGHAKAQAILGCCCDLGLEVKKDSHEAVLLYRKAAKANDPLAQYRLGQDRSVFSFF